MSRVAIVGCGGVLPIDALIIGVIDEENPRR